MSYVLNFNTGDVSTRNYFSKKTKLRISISENDLKSSISIFLEHAEVLNLINGILMMSYISPIENKKLENLNFKLQSVENALKV